MSKIREYGFCPFSNRMKEEDCDMYAICDSCSDYFSGYEKGRADKYQEIVSEYMLLTEKQVAEIRADTIDECKKIVMAECTTTCEYPFSPNCVECMSNKMEQLKEQK